MGGVLRAGQECVLAGGAAEHLPRGGPHSQADIDEARRVYDEATPIATEIAGRYVDQVRLNPRQYWLGSSASAPRTTWRNELHDVDGKRLAVGFSHAGVMVLLNESHALTVR